MTPVSRRAAHCYVTSSVYSHGPVFLEPYTPLRPGAGISGYVGRGGPGTERSARNEKRGYSLDARTEMLVPLRSTLTQPSSYDMIAP